MFGLSSCWWVVARYSLDFMMLIGASSVVLVEAGLTNLRAIGVRILPLRLAVAALACYSIVMGLMLGFMGPGEAFKIANPATFQMISDWFK
jgi:DNA-directed RNA polymerase subunit beta.